MPLIQFKNSSNLKILNYKMPASYLQLLNYILNASEKLTIINISLKSLNQETFNLLPNLKYLECLELDITKVRVINNFEFNELSSISSLNFGSRVNDSSWPLIQKLISDCKNLKKLVIPYNFKNSKYIKQIIEKSGKLEDLIFNCSHMWKSLDNISILSITIKKLTLIDFYYFGRGLYMLKSWPRLDTVIIKYDRGGTMRLEHFSYSMNQFPNLSIKQLNSKEFIINGFQ
jgi:hypothetical protein